MVETHHLTLVQTHRMYRTKVNPHVNSRLWAITMCEHWSLDSNTHLFLMGVIDIGDALPLRRGINTWKYPGISINVAVFLTEFLRVVYLNRKHLKKKPVWYQSSLFCSQLWFILWKQDRQTIFVDRKAKSSTKAREGKHPLMETCCLPFLSLRESFISWNVLSSFRKSA